MIRKTLTATCAAVALAAGLAAPTSAAARDISADTSNVYFNTLMPGDGLDTYGTFGDAFANKGTTFDDVFRFFSPPVNSQVSFDGLVDYLNGMASVKFTGFDFGVFVSENYDNDTGDFLGITVDSLATTDASGTKFAFNGESRDFLNSGIYYIEVKGTTLLDGGGFSGHINTTAIPEPTNIALMLAGLGLVGTMARRRKAKAA